MCADGRAWHSAAMSGTAGKIHYGDDEVTFAEIAGWTIDPGAPEPQGVIKGPANPLLVPPQLVKMNRHDRRRAARMSKSRLTKTRGQAQ
jgi:hypothetical protein